MARELGFELKYKAKRWIIGRWLGPPQDYTKINLDGAKRWSNSSIGV